MSEPVLEIKGLSVSYQTEIGVLKALRDVSLRIEPGRIVGIVGESGCGKSTLISSIIQLMPPNAVIEHGEILFKDTDLLTLDTSAMQDVRGGGIAMVFQDPMTSLNPVLTIGRQMAHIQYREQRTYKEKGLRSIHMLERVGIPDAGEMLGRYPHQLSGGMRQRVAIAMAMMMEPALE